MKRMLMPIRAVIEALGGTIAWDNASRTVSITMNTSEFHPHAPKRA